jgi:hypothetical protein
MKDLFQNPPTKEDFSPTNFILVLTGIGKTPRVITWPAYLAGVCPFSHWQRIERP